MVGLEWHKDVELTLRMLCIRDFKLAWSPRMEQDILRSYTSWADVYRQKEKFWRLVNTINTDEKAAGMFFSHIIFLLITTFFDVLIGIN